MTIVKQINKLVAEFEHTKAGELTMRVVGTDLPLLEKEVLNDLANELIGLLHDELRGQGLL